MTFIPYQIYRFEERLRPELRSVKDEKEINLQCGQTEKVLNLTGGSKPLCVSGHCNERQTVKKEINKQHCDNRRTTKRDC